MAGERGYQVVTKPAAADLTGRQYTFVILNSSGQWAAPGGAGAVCHGILLNEPNAAGLPAEAALIGAGGVMEIRTDATIAPGEAVGCLDATGVGRQAVQNDYIMGYALGGDGGVAGRVSLAMSHNGRLP